MWTAWPARGWWPARYGDAVPLVAAAVCPHPPIIVPALAGSAASELAGLREACDEAITRLVDSAARRVVVVGADNATFQHHLPTRGSFAPWGVPVEVAIGDPDRAAGRPPLPLSLSVAAWLVNRQPGVPPDLWHLVSVARDAPVADCARLADKLAETGAAGADEPWALLVMGDGSACRGERSPGYDDPAAEPYDDGVAEALATADAQALLAFSPELSARLRATGRAPWQVLAAATLRSGLPWRGDVSYYAAPYGVSYFVANWAPAVPSGPSR
ncbi:class III extradiol dioxygenase subunit B-like domain-containing protein [Plantactinospora sonchi]|uniref:Class III extradiol dioxygenase subunit B-like domain-containing protein n=1 Tax=Plantactinospora sonchi TaxID=1544735 RepID=A0ABU7S2W7_9ACTN